MLLRDMEDAEKPASRLRRHGPGAMSNQELLALVLNGGDDALERSGRILAMMGGVSGLAASGFTDLLDKGLGPVEANRLAALLELVRRIPAESLTGRDLLNEPRVVKEFLRNTQGDDTQERTGALYLNARNRLIKNDPEIYKGTLDRAIVEPREILRRALLGRAAGIILYHNHPSGDPTPSREDREFTRNLASACTAIGVRLLDHVVVGREGCVSFREAGLL